MKLNEFENNDSQLNISRPEEIKQFISKNCSEILSTYKSLGKVLFRGMRYIPADVFIGKPPEFRIPKDISLEHQNRIDTHLRAVGIKALRSNSIFCNPTSEEAAQYGTVFMIFPIDGFSYSWCASADDLWATYFDASDMKVKQFKDDLVELPPTEFVKIYGFSDKYLEQAIVKKHEVLIHGNYIAVRYGTNLGKELAVKIRQGSPLSRKRTMKNLEGALKIATASVFHFGLLAHTAHFNVVGPRFYELHILLERIYSDVEDSFDAFGEQIRSLDIMCPFNLRQYMSLSALEEPESLLNPQELIHSLLLNNDIVVDVLTQTNKLAIDHIGLQNFLQGRCEVHDKNGWMLRATLQNGR